MYPDYVVSSLFQSVPDGTTDNISRSDLTDQVFFLGGGADSETSGIKFFYDNRNGFLCSGNNNTGSFEFNRGQHSTCLGDVNTIAGSNSLGTGQNNTIDIASAQCFVSGQNNTINDCLNSSVSGDGNTLANFATNIFMHGNGNSLIGSPTSNTLVTGNNNSIQSSFSDSAIFGSSHTINVGLGNDNMLITGRDHDIIDCEDTLISGRNNTVSQTASSIISGRDHTSIFASSNVTVGGINNTVSTCTNSTVNGANNTVSTSNNVLVSGNDLTVTNTTDCLVAGRMCTVGNAAGSPATTIRSFFHGNALNSTGINQQYSYMWGNNNQNMQDFTIYTFLMGRNHAVNTAGTRDIYAIGSAHIANNTNEEPCLLMGQNSRDGGFRAVNISNCRGTALIGTADDQCLKKYHGGYTFYTNDAKTTGVTVGAGGSSWSMVSDVKVKENLVALDTANCLTQVNNIPVYSFNYIQEESVDPITDEIIPAAPKPTCMFPTAQDWNAAFPSTKDPGKICSMDIIGVLMGCVQELTKKVESLQNQIDLLSS